MSWVDWSFQISHLASVIFTVDASLHVAMDKYAMFAITCSEDFLDKYIKLITAENEKWQTHFADGEIYAQKS